MSSISSLSVSLVLESCNISISGSLHESTNSSFDKFNFEPYTLMDLMHISFL